MLGVPKKKKKKETAFPARVSLASSKGGRQRFLLVVLEKKKNQAREGLARLASKFLASLARLYSR